MEDNSKVEEQEVEREMVNENEEAVQGKSEQAVGELEQAENAVVPSVRKSGNLQGMTMILSIILLAAVVVLYVLFFTKKEKTTPIAAITSEHTGLVLTINNDSIVEYFVLVKLLKTDLENETARYQAELQRESAKFEEKYRNYMINVQNNVLTQTQMQNSEKFLMDEKTRLEELSAKYTEIITRKEISVHREILDSITNATKRINDAFYRADYVFATSENSAIFYANPAHDITAQVIEELNNTYNKAHKK